MENESIEKRSIHILPLDPEIMAQTQSANTEAQPVNTLVLDTETGTLVSENSFSIGAGATIAKWSADQKKADRATVNTAPAEKVEKQPQDLTIRDNITGAEVRITANATVGIDTEGVRFNKFGTKSALRLLLAATGFNRSNISNDLIEALSSDDVPAAAAILGFSAEALEAADELIESLGTESTVVVAGRQQVSGFSAE